MTLDLPNAETRKKISDYLQLEENDLFSIAGVYVTEPGTMFSPEGQIKAGKSAFEQMQSALKTKLCNGWDLCSKIKDDYFMDPINLIAAIGDIVAGLTIGVPPLVIGTIVFKIGIREFCDCPDRK